MPGCRFSRAIGHKAASAVGVLHYPNIDCVTFDDKSLMKIKILLLSSQLQYLTNNSRFREMFINFKFAEEDLKSQVTGVIKQLEKNEQVHLYDYGLVYVYQN